MRLVIIESPYAGNAATVEMNLKYLHECIYDCLRRGEAPIASHLLYTKVLDDTEPLERALGIAAGFAWAHAADAVAVYEDNGISPGMRAAIDIHQKRGRQVEFRKLRA